MPGSNPHNTWHDHVLCMSMTLLLATLRPACVFATATLSHTAHHQALTSAQKPCMC